MIVSEDSSDLSSSLSRTQSPAAPNPSCLRSFPKGQGAHQRVVANAITDHVGRLALKRSSVPS